MRKGKYVDLLKEKFGDEVLKSMLDFENMKLNFGSAEERYSKINTKEIIKEFYPEVSFDVDWAFDFPSWIGSLDFSKPNVKDIMVIGMEPHVRNEKISFQATYGLRETAPNEFKELSNGNKPLSNGNNPRLWNNLNALFGSSEDYENRDFLSKFYVTDLSHFAVSGKAKEVNKIKGWPKTRNEIAKKFLKREIEVINPKYIVSQGNAVADFIDRMLDSWELEKNIQPQDFECGLLPERCKNTPAFKRYSLNGNKTIHLRLPHIASGNGNYFWIPAKKNAEIRKARLQGIRSVIESLT